MKSACRIVTENRPKMNQSAPVDAHTHGSTQGAVRTRGSGCCARRIHTLFVLHTHTPFFPVVVTCFTLESRITTEPNQSNDQKDKITKTTTIYLFFRDPRALLCDLISTRARFDSSERQTDRHGMHMRRQGPKKKNLGLLSPHRRMLRCSCYPQM